MKSLLKEVKRSEDLYIEFSKEELNSLNMKEGDKFSWKEDKDGFLLEKLVPLSMDISEFSRESLEYLIISSLEQDITINEVFTNVISEYIKNYDKTV
jgi:hypothetical protein